MMPFVDSSRLDWVEINSEKLKLIYDELVEEAGVDVLFDAQVCAVERKKADCDCNVHSVDTDALREKLRGYGAYIL